MNNLPRPPPPALAELFRRWNPPGVPAVEAVFSEGHSNRNFLVRLGEQRCVVRLADEDSGRFGIDREAEYRVLQRMAQLELGAEVLYCEPASGALVTVWLPSRPLRVEGLGADDVLDRLAHALQVVHAQEIDAPSINLVERIRFYARQIQNDDPRNWPRARRWLASARPVMEQYRFARWRKGLCHNDLVGPNILDTELGLRFIDWEYAGRGDPFLDLATLAEEQGFDALDRQRLLLAYGEVGDAAVDHLYRVRVLYRLLSGLWYLVRLRGARTELLPALQRQEQALDALLRQGPGD